MRTLPTAVLVMLLTGTLPATGQELREASQLKLPFDVKVRMQGRIDGGDLLIDTAGRYRTESDLFLRRVRLEIDKKLERLPVGEELEINITFDADRFEQDLRGGERREPRNRVDLRYLYGDWKIADAAGLKIGKHKLPYSRISLTSSARQLLIERPAATEAGKDIFGDYQQVQVQLHGELWQGRLGYYLAGADGANSLGAIEELDGGATAVQARSWGKAFIGRLELSPLGFTPLTTDTSRAAFVEEKKDDTGMGEKTHLTIGIYGGMQEDIRYATASVADATVKTNLVGADLAGRYVFGTGGALTGQAEYLRFRRDFNYRDDERPQGYYFQFGYLLAGTFLRGKLEPTVRYEAFDHDRTDNDDGTGTREESLAAGFNHYILKHSLKWSYNFVYTSFDAGAAETVSHRNRIVHQVQLQLYF